MKNETKIEFINHASVLISYGKIGILSDPWYFSSVFHKGWRLIHENQMDYIKSVFSKTSHIYISHEHPDHFNPKFLLEKSIKDLIIKNNILSFSKKQKIKEL